MQGIDAAYYMIHSMAAKGDFADKDRLAERLMTFIREWNEIAHPFHWTSKSVAKVMAKCQVEDAKPLAEAAWDFRS